MSPDRAATLADLQARRVDAERRFAADPHRPRYHFLPPGNWMNDPNGPIFAEGLYHLFYQHNPAAARWGDIHWGQAVSEDLVHWSDWPIALAPRDEIDRAGVYTGCAFLDDEGAPVIAYTGVPTREGKPGVRSDNQSLARSDDGLWSWRKLPENPVIAGPPEGLDVTGFRDPCVWREPDGWRMIVGSGIAGEGGCALLYRSDDLLAWEYLHPLCVGDAERHGTMWECPDFFALGGRHVLLVSTLGRQLGFVGHYHGNRFEPSREGWVDFAPCFYAGKSFEAPGGRRILWGWLREARGSDAQLAAGWSGVMSLPRELSLLTDGTLGAEPAVEVQALRRERTEHTDIVLHPGASLNLPPGDCVEVALEASVDDGARLVLELRRSPDGEECTRVVVEGAALSVDTSRASLDPAAVGRVGSGALPTAAAEPLHLRALLDRSVLEVFANGRCITERLYPARGDSLGLRLIVEEGGALLHRLDSWQMATIWPEI